MKERSSRVVVVDASVARSAGESDQHPVGRCCRDALLEMLRICHRVAMTPKITREWKEHATRFSWKWWRAMAAKKKVETSIRPADLACPPRESLGLSPKDDSALRKDLHLVEAACAADGVILTRDIEIENIWAKCSGAISTPKKIVWLNPERDGVERLSSL